ncbi:MAG TPA: hypothetical protein EYN06_04135 [Myxococcales bacterium]|nr:hypothetical protein [Myxococcales bacterium]HIN85650.1 hypothetical protein [Myxococcales bacterium]
MDNQDHTLYSGAAKGAEACFGENSERWKLNEVNYSFDGHKDSRTRGLKVLNREELMTGDVSLAYIGKLMNREYKNTPLFKNVLRSIWHQINSGQQVFVVGTINEDDTVKGGTGWGAEFAKLCNKPLYVFEQNKGQWMQWQRSKFVACDEDPSITETHFTGTGTRSLNSDGRQAIAALFAQSFA